MLIDINFYQRINKNIDIGMQNNFLPCYSCHKVYDQIFIYDILRSASRLKSASTPQISIHWCHYLKSWSDLRVFSNRRPFQILRSMADLLVRVRVKALVSDIIGRRFEKVRNDHRFENWTPIWEFEKGQMSVT
jgi:hypothetical protein